MQLPAWIMFDRRVSESGTLRKAKFDRMFELIAGKCRLRRYAFQDLTELQILEGIPMDHLRGKPNERPVSARHSHHFQPPWKPGPAAEVPAK